MQNHGYWLQPQGSRTPTIPYCEKNDNPAITVFGQLRRTKQGVGRRCSRNSALLTSRILLKWRNNRGHLHGINSQGSAARWFHCPVWNLSTIVGPLPKAEVSTNPTDNKDSLPPFLRNPALRNMPGVDRDKLGILSEYRTPSRNGKEYERQELRQCRRLWVVLRISYYFRPANRKLLYEYCVVRIKARSHRISD